MSFALRVAQGTGQTLSRRHKKQHALRLNNNQLRNLKMANHRSIAGFFTIVFCSCMIIRASANPGCYDTGSHTCSCDVIEASCTGTKTWSDGCKCAVHTGSAIDLKGTWGACSTGRYGPTGFCPSNQNLTASTGDYLEFTVGAGDDVISFDTAATAYDNCDLSNVQTLVDNTKHSVAGYVSLTHSSPPLVEFTLTLCRYIDKPLTFSHLFDLTRR